MHRYSHSVEKAGAPAFCLPTVVAARCCIEAQSLKLENGIAIPFFELQQIHADNLQSSSGG
jgi:hypothetical protein